MGAEGRSNRKRVLAIRAPPKFEQNSALPGPAELGPLKNQAAHNRSSIGRKTLRHCLEINPFSVNSTSGTPLRVQYLVKPTDDSAYPPLGKSSGIAIYLP